MSKLSEKQESLLKEERVGRLATISKDNSIHIVPVCYVYDGESILIGTDLHSRKIFNIKRNKNVSIVIDRYVEDWSKLKGLMIQGEAFILESGEEFNKARKLLYEKYPQYKQQAPIEEGESAIIKISIKRVIAWDSGYWIG
ncbi:MAG: pyridoxamine 5'-phosphate oxidase family protein [Nitrososphaerales archaeon]